MYKRIVVGLDGSGGSKAALQAAMNLARSSKAELFLVSIQELPHYPAAIDEFDDERDAAAQFLKGVQDEAIERVTSAGLVAHHLIFIGHAAREVPQYAVEVGADLLVIGHSGHSGIWGRLLGTTADKIVDHAPCSVLVVR